MTASNTPAALRQLAGLCIAGALSAAACAEVDHDQMSTQQVQQAATICDVDGGHAGAGGSSGETSGGASGTGNTAGSGASGGNNAVGGSSGGGPFTHFIEVPSGVFLDSVALGASNSMTVGDRGEVLQGSIVNVGAGDTSIGHDAQVLNIFSQGVLTLNDRAIVSGFIKAGSSVEIGFDVEVDTALIDLGASILPAEQYGLFVEVPSGDPPDAAVNTGASVSLNPGFYGSYTLDGTLELSTGEYFFQGLIANAGGLILIDQQAGPVVLHVLTNSSFASDILVSVGGPNPDLVVMFHGSTSFILDKPVNGFVLALNAHMHFHGGGIFRGAFFAKSITLDPDVDVIHRPFDIAHFFPGSSGTP